MKLVWRYTQSFDQKGESVIRVWSGNHSDSNF